MFDFVSQDNLPFFIVASGLIVAGLALLLAGAINALRTPETDGE